MKSEHDEAERILNRALEFAPEEREVFLSGACGDDAALRDRVATLLKAHDEADQFLNDGITIEETPVSEGPGTVIGRYKLLQQIGEGGMGVVYMAEQTEPVRRKVALKIIRLGMDTKHVVARFEAERQALALMDHSNIANVLDAGATDSGRPYFVMELVQGVPITDFCEKNKLSTRERLDLFLPVCHAIQSAHQKGVIHRDIKPSNVLVSLHHGEPMAKVIDFGIAKATHQRLTEKTLFTNYATMIGTPAYMSPEQAEMSTMDVDTRTDVYSLGVLLYELLTGTTPISEQRLRSVGYGEMQKIISEEEPEKPSTRVSRITEQSVKAGRTLPEDANHSLRGDLDWIVMKCLEKDRRRRYGTPNELAADVERHLEDRPVVARPPTLNYRFQKAWRRNKVAYSAAAVLIIGLLIGLGGMMHSMRASRAEAEARMERNHEATRREEITHLAENLLGELIPESIEKGDRRQARVMLDRVETLADSLENSPAAELAIRYRIFFYYRQSMRDMAGSQRNEARMAEILEAYPEMDTEVMSNLGHRVALIASEMFRKAAQGDFDFVAECESQLIEMREEGREQNDWKAQLNATWNLAAYAYSIGSFEVSAERYAEGLVHLPHNVRSEFAYGYRARFAGVETRLGRTDEALKILDPVMNQEPEGSWANEYWYQECVRAYVNALCVRGSWGEVLAWIDDWKGRFEDVPARVRLLEELRGYVLWRRGEMKASLGILEKLLTEGQGNIEIFDWAMSAAGYLGDDEAVRRLSALGMAEFVSGSDGRGAGLLVYTLLQVPQPQTVTDVCGHLLERIKPSVSIEGRSDVAFWNYRLRGLLAMRQGKYLQARESFLDTPEIDRKTPVAGALMLHEFGQVDLPYHLALCEARLGNRSAAVNYFKQGDAILLPELESEKVDLAPHFHNLLGSAKAMREGALEVLREEGIEIE